MCPREPAERCGYRRKTSRSTSPTAATSQEMMEIHHQSEGPHLAEMMPCNNSAMCDTMLYPWNWGEEARNVNLSPGSSCSSPEYERTGGKQRTRGSSSSRQEARGSSAERHRRGRPRADALTNLMMQGSTSPSSIKCSFCNRVFPREKSLQAHLRTHTGEFTEPDYRKTSLFSHNFSESHVSIASSTLLHTQAIVGLHARGADITSKLWPRF